MNIFDLLPTEELSPNAQKSLEELSPSFVESLSFEQAQIVFKATSWFDKQFNGTKTPREFQLQSTVATLSGQNVVVRAGTGYGKTMAMVLPLLLGDQSKIAITISPLKLLQKNHVHEFEQYGIKTVQINEDTPDDKNLWKDIAQGVYRNILVAPEQFFRHNGHLPRLAFIMLTSRAFVKSIGFLNCDEAHMIQTAGLPRRGEEYAFRPAYGKIANIRALLAKDTPILVLSATLPPPTLYTVLGSLRLDPDQTLKILQPTNHPNHFYAVHELHGSISNLKNYNFLIPLYSNPTMPPKTVIFVENREATATIARHLRKHFPPSLQTDRIVAHLHAGMSPEYNDEIYNDFMHTDKISTLISTSAASHGINSPNIARIICVGAPCDEITMLQMFGRGGRTPTLETVCLVIAEPWALTTEESDKPSAREKRADPGIREYISLKTCRRAYLAAKDGDTSPEATTFLGPHCCDNCGRASTFDPAQLFPRPFHTQKATSDGETQSQSQPSTQKKKDNIPKPKTRSRTEHDELRQRLETLRSEIAPRLDYAWPESYLLSKKHIDTVVLSPLDAIPSTAALVKLLSENSEWAEDVAPSVFEVIAAHDADLAARKAEAAALKRPVQQHSQSQAEYSQQLYSYNSSINLNGWTHEDPAARIAAQEAKDASKPQKSKKPSKAKGKRKNTSTLSQHDSGDAGPSQTKRQRTRSPSPSPSNTQPRVPRPKPRQRTNGPVEIDKELYSSI
ncbi:P-loop containing nucleoside triphosphate hydrolase protein [Coniophora puteana RWD-64-598 SS2]|uniref:DNA 3'-5' helicase n=1 Tax=Coniophora puteana (strain RWD-64-598) TaxID=741705 RepID=A0A5M3MMA7_CONPW|nr:P-loop containing nucleoside triphosphate hydrolase protein [Coniophora puteana RWD-64-598 SS2]EIW80150.1 P-loop containing nucleoside triphosphate hydrolase protein [Coniophora puteana RWD-64-598 SS2]